MTEWDSDSGTGGKSAGPSVATTAAAPRAAHSALTVAWPRALIAAGKAAALTDWWLSCRARAERAGQPGFPRTALTNALAQVLFDCRRARQLVRGVEGAEARLRSQQAGLQQSAAAQTRPGQRRISRLLVVSADGSERFYHQIERLHAEFSARLEVLVVEADEIEFGQVLFGPGKRVRAVLIDHKEAVLRVLEVLLGNSTAGPGEHSD